jgi:alpha/beta superfamily hydrolase
MPMPMEFLRFVSPRIVSIFLLMALAGAGWLGAQAPAEAPPEGEAPEPAAAAPVDAFPLTGLYAGEGPHQMVAVSPRTLGEETVLVFTDLGTGDVRAMFPAGDGVYAAGETMVKPEPAAYRLTFRPGGALEIRETASGAAWNARKLSARREEVELQGEGAVLRGTLHLPPSGAGPFPGAVLVGGSEADGDRHSFDALPYVLAHRGIAVLAYDKRGTGASEGSWDVAHDPLAADLLAALAFLDARDDLSDTLGVIGFSEGSWVAPLAASRSEAIDFIVAISGGVLPKAESFLHKARRELEEQGLAGEALETAFAEKQAVIEASADREFEGEGVTPFDQRMLHDPEPQWVAFRGPVLALFGEWDTLVPAERSAARLREVLTKARHPDFTIRVFPKAHHSLFLGVTGSPSEFARMEGIRGYVPGYWETLLSWLDGRAGGGR